MCVRRVIFEGGARAGHSVTGVWICAQALGGQELTVVEGRGQEGGDGEGRKGESRREVGGGGTGGPVFCLYHLAFCAFSTMLELNFLYQLSRHCIHFFRLARALINFYACSIFPSLVLLGTAMVACGKTYMQEILSECIGRDGRNVMCG
jgi:hypothetical protein